MKNRERLGSRLGFIMLSAGCAIGCGNVWKFPWMCGQNGGGGFMLVYLACLILFRSSGNCYGVCSGRAIAGKSSFLCIESWKNQATNGESLALYVWLEILHWWHFILLLLDGLSIISLKFLTGQNDSFGFEAMITNPGVNVTFLLVTVVAAFAILSFNLQGGLERVTKYMMVSLLILMMVLAIHGLTLSGAKEGLKFYLVPDFQKLMVQ